MARACLNLMAAMVTQGPEAARDVCSHFDLNKKTLYTLVTKRDSKVRWPEHLIFPVGFLPLWRHRDQLALLLPALVSLQMQQEALVWRDWSLGGRGT